MRFPVGRERDYSWKEGIRRVSGKRGSITGDKVFVWWIVSKNNVEGRSEGECMTFWTEKNCNKFCTVNGQVFENE